MSMWTLHPRALKIINYACTLFGFDPLLVLHGIRAWVLLSVFNCSCVSTDAARHMFRQLMNKIDKRAHKDMTFEKDFSDEDDVSAVKELVLMALTAHIPGENVDLHVKLRREISELTLAKASSIGAVRIDIFRRLR